MDALEVVRVLERAGFSRQQAEAITEAVEKATLGSSARLATRDDVADLRTELAAIRTELKAEIAALRAELKEEIATVCAELKEEIATVRAEIGAVRAEIGAVRAELHREIGGLTWKATGLLLAQAAFIIAFIKLLP